MDHLQPQDDELILRDVRVPASNILGEIGKAFALGKQYQNACWVRAAARKVGITARLLEQSALYARDWKALGQPLSVRPSVQRDLADMAIEIDAARWLIYQAAWAIDEGKDAREAAPRAYLFASQLVQRTIEIYGGPAHAFDLPLLRIYAKDRKSDTPILNTLQTRITHELVTGGEQ